MGNENVQSSLASTLGAPGGTAPTFPNQDGSPLPSQQASPQQQDQVRQLIARIMQASKQGGTQLAKPVPSPLPQMGGVSGIQPGMHGDKGADILGTIGSVVLGGVSMHKAAKQAHAESQWNQLSTLIQGGDQQKINAWLTANQKDLKNMAKSLNQDWLNPEKTDVWKEALNKTVQTQQQKGQAADGLKKMFQHLIGRAVKPQLDQGQQQKMAQEIQGKAPVAQHAGLDRDTTQLLLEQMKEAEKDKEFAAKEKQEQQKQNWTERRDSFKATQEKELTKMKDAHAETLQSMRDEAAASREDKRIVKEMQMLNMKEADKFKMTPSELNKSMNGTTRSLDSQYSAAQAQVRKLEDNITKMQKMVQDKGWTKFWKDDPDIQGAQDDLKEAKAQAQRYKAGSDFIAKNRQKVLTGQADWDEVLGRAQSIMQGDLSDLGGTPEK